jgi:hypothetical protein
VTKQDKPLKIFRILPNRKIHKLIRKPNVFHNLLLYKKMTKECKKNAIIRD